MSREMKDSGIEWIGDIPSDWEIRKIKNMASGEDGLLMDGDWIEGSVIQENGIRYLTTGNIGRGEYKEQGNGYISQETFDNLKCLNVLPGDLIISRLNEPIGRACILPSNYERYVIAVDNVVLRPNSKYDKRYLMYCMNIEGYNHMAKLASRGTTMPRISRTMLGIFQLPAPYAGEQYQIANYLDNKISQIDTIIQKQTQLIEDYKIYKQSLITETVTKGLNPNVEMKDSGIEWIGMVPKHWRVCKLKYISNMKSGSSITSDQIDKDGIYKVYGGNGFRGYTDKFNHSGEYILIGRQGALCGNVKLVRGEFWASEHAIVTYQKEFINNKWLANMLYAMNLNQYSTSAAQPGLSVEQIQNLSTCIPELNEQTKIANFLQCKSINIDKAIAQKQILIKELEAYKKSLIYECVTGKREVSTIPSSIDELIQPAYEEVAITKEGANHNE